MKVFRFQVTNHLGETFERELKATSEQAAISHMAVKFDETAEYALISVREQTAEEIQEEQSLRNPDRLPTKDPTQTELKQERFMRLGGWLVILGLLSYAIIAWATEGQANRPYFLLASLALGSLLIVFGYLLPKRRKRLSKRNSK